MDPPNPWDVLHDDAKAYITLATALLGITATFADKLLSDDKLGRIVVIAGWGILVASVGLSIYASGAVFAGIKAASANYSAAARYLNKAVILLAIGAAALAFGAWRTSLSHEQQRPSPSPTSVARSALAEITGVSQRALTIESLDRTSTNEFVLSIEARGSHTEYQVTVDSVRHEVIKVAIIRQRV